jgi:ATP-binding cassette subfamily B protein
MKRPFKPVLRVYLEHMKPYAFSITCLFLIVALAEGSSATIPVVFGALINTVVQAANSNAIAQSAPALIKWLLLIGAIRLCAGLLWRSSGLIAAYAQTRVFRDLECTAFNKILEHSYRFFSNNFAGALTRKVQRLALAFRDVAETVLWRLTPVLASLVVIVVAVSIKNLFLGLTIFVWTTLFLFAGIYLAWKRSPLDFKKAELDSQIGGFLADVFANALNTKIFNNKNQEIESFAQLADERRVAGQNSWSTMEKLTVSQNLLSLVAETSTLGAALWLWKLGRLSVGDVVMIQTYLITFFSKTYDLGRVVMRAYEAIADAKEMVDILHLPLEVVDARQAKTLLIKKASIKFDQVSFHYQKGVSTLKDVTLAIAPGERVALVGPSGAGKSTIVKMLFRFFDLTNGRILIDDQPIDQVTQESLRAQIALVPQDTVLFHRTLLENIRYGNPHTTDKEVIAAAKQARCHEFIEVLPQKYQTLVGERGIKLSGGERQRVAIARAILKDAPILVLDEATSSLDSESELLIQDALRELMQGRTVLVIAHRLSTIMQMDRIVVMEHGKIVDIGSHQELLAKPTIYKRLWQIQAGGFGAEATAI